MGGPAKLFAIDAVQILHAAMVRFGEQAMTAVGELDLEVHRGMQWFTHDCKDYWGEQVRRASEQVSEARIALQRRQMFKIGDRPPSCDDERKALDKARLRLRLAEQKVEAVRRWKRILDHEVIEFRGAIGPLAGWLQADLPKALAALDRMARALEHYVALKTPAQEGRTDGQDASGAAPAAPGAGPQPSGSAPPPAPEEPRP